METNVHGGIGEDTEGRDVARTTLAFASCKTSLGEVWPPEIGDRDTKWGWDTCMRRKSGVTAVPQRSVGNLFPKGRRSQVHGMDQKVLLQYPFNGHEPLAPHQGTIVPREII